MVRLMYGAPQAHSSQIPMVPWFILGMGSFMFLVRTATLYTEGLSLSWQAQDWRGRKKGVIESVQHVGFGLWQVVYTYNIGPKKFMGTRIDVSVQNQMGHQFILPYTRRWYYLQPGREVEVKYTRTLGGASKPCLETTPAPEYVIGGLVAFGIAAMAFYTTNRVFWTKMKLYALHNTEEGAQFLRRSMTHVNTGQPGPPPVEQWLHSTYPLFASQDLSYSMTSYHQKVRQNANNPGRVWRVEQTTQEMIDKADAHDAIAAEERREQLLAGAEQQAAIAAPDAGTAARPAADPPAAASAADPAAADPAAADPAAADPADAPTSERSAAAASAADGAAGKGAAGKGGPPWTAAAA